MPRTIKDRVANFYPTGGNIYHGDSSFKGLRVTCG